MLVKRVARKIVRTVQQWLDDVPVPEVAPVPFDNTYEWLTQSFRSLCADDVSRRRPAYVWGALQGAALAKIQGHPRISLIEFGVAGGAGLLSLERTAELAEALVNVEIDVHGFDSGVGLPPSRDYRDMPYLWGEGFFPMEKDKLEARLRRARLHLGPLHQTLPEFLRQPFAPVAFVAFDLDMYTSTRDSLELLSVDAERLMPRIPCYFDDIMGYFANDFAGERLAIAEFNAEHATRKLSPQHGLKYFAPVDRHDMWPEMMYFAHNFDHTAYNSSAFVTRGSIIDIDDTVVFTRS